jgi:hypothetical protein
MRPKPAIPSEIDDYRDERWCREGTRQVGTPLDAERFIEQVGFAACLTDSRRPGPSLYIAVCGRRDAVLPRNVQKDSETSPGRFRVVFVHKATPPCGERGPQAPSDPPESVSCPLIHTVSCIRRR